MCSMQSDSCVPRRASRVFKARHFLCCTWSNSCVPSKTYRVLHARHFVRSTQDIPCVPRRTFRVFQAGRFLCSNRTFLVFQSSYHLIIISSYHHIIILANQKKVQVSFGPKVKEKSKSTCLPLHQKSRRAAFQNVWGSFSRRICW